MYVFCGYDGSVPGRLQDTDEYDASANSWSNRTNCPSPTRFYLSAVTLSNKGYIFGGDAGYAYLQDNDEYVPDTWTSKTDMPTPARGHGAASDVSNKGYMCCGDQYGGATKLKDCDEYTPDTWASKTDAPDPKRYHLSAASV
jgi:N-acetylneuraminic acid mutarotase